MKFSIKDLIPAGSLSGLLTGKMDPAAILNGPFGDKVSKGFADFLKTFERKDDEHAIVAMVHEKNGETYISILALIANDAGLKIGRLISEHPLKKIGDLITEIQSKTSSNTQTNG